MLSFPRRWNSSCLAHKIIEVAESKAILGTYAGPMRGCGSRRSGGWSAIWKLGSLRGSKESCWEIPFPPSNAPEVLGLYRSAGLGGNDRAAHHGCVKVGFVWRCD